MRKDEVERWTHVFFAFTHNVVDNVRERGSRYAGRTAETAKGEERDIFCNK